MIDVVQNILVVLKSRVALRVEVWFRFREWLTSITLSIVPHY